MLNPDSAVSHDDLAQLGDAVSALTTVEGMNGTPASNIFLYQSEIERVSQPITYQTCLVLLIQGEKTCHFADRSFDYGRGDVLFVSSPLHVTCHNKATTDEPLIGLVLALDLEPLLEMARHMDLSFSVPPEKVAPLKQQRQQQTHHLFSITHMNTAIATSALRLVETLSDPNKSAVLTPGQQTELLYHILQTEIGSEVAQIATSKHIQAILRTIHTMNATFASTIDVDQLATAAGMSTSRFHFHFKAVTGQTPMQYIKTLRLHQAREMILQQQMNAKEAAQAVGYVSASQFSREYKRYFGQSVREELAAAVP